KENGKVLLSLKRTNDFCDVWYFRQDFDLKDVILQEGETVDKKYATAREIIAMRDRGEFVPFRYLDQLLDMIDQENG
ncbi:MAG: NUDIX hydrolase, partial [Clostridia bacterium]|nr:NUDIX hydrolase [Clostridia bacterium]